MFEISWQIQQTHIDFSQISDPDSVALQEWLQAAPH